MVKYLVMKSLFGFTFHQYIVFSVFVLEGGGWVGGGEFEISCLKKTDIKQFEYISNKANIAVFLQV